VISIERRSTRLCDHERGEFFTFGYECPEFYTEISITVGEIVEREGFWPASLCPGDGKRCFLSVCYGKAVSPAGETAIGRALPRDTYRSTECRSTSARVD
jgi:hypothetical protein